MESLRNCLAALLIYGISYLSGIARLIIGTGDGRLSAQTVKMLLWSYVIAKDSKFGSAHRSHNTYEMTGRWYI